jgi:hypothetical protein
MPERQLASPPAATLAWTPHSTPIKTTPFSPSAFLNSPATVSRQLTAIADSEQTTGPSYTSTPSRSDIKSNRCTPQAKKSCSRLAQMSVLSLTNTSLLNLSPCTPTPLRTNDTNERKVGRASVKALSSLLQGKDTETVLCSPRSDCVDFQSLKKERNGSTSSLEDNFQQMLQLQPITDVTYGSCCLHPISESETGFPSDSSPVATPLENYEPELYSNSPKLSQTKLSHWETIALGQSDDQKMLTFQARRWITRCKPRSLRL